MKCPTGRNRKNIASQKFSAMRYAGIITMSIIMADTEKQLVDSQMAVSVSTTVLGSWSERAIILTVYALLALPVMVSSEVLPSPTVVVPVSAPPLVFSQ